MGIQKIIFFIVTFGLLSSCQDKKANLILKSEYDDLMKEYAELKNENSASRKEILDQATILNKTLEQISIISNKTAVLRENVEAGAAKISQADNIESNILAIKEKIEEYEKIISNNSELLKTLTSLKQIITEKEKELKTLKSVISKQNKEIETQRIEINNQKKEITNQSNIITAKEKELQNAVNRQVELLYRAGLEFENIAYQDVDIKNSLFRNNKNKVEAYKRKILQKAAQYYSIAAEMGHPQAKIKASKLKYYL